MTRGRQTASQDVGAAPTAPLEDPAARAARIRSRISTREALRFLTDAGQTLAGSLDYETTLQSVADLAVPRIACYCIVDILEKGGEVRRLGMAHVDPSRLPTLERTAAFVSSAPGSPALSEPLGSCEPLLVSPITEEWLRASARDEEHLECLRALQTTSLIVVPLQARGSALGELVLGSTRTDRFYGDDDVILARELSRIAAVAIDNARLYRQAQEAVRARDEVLRVVSHDLRNPLGAISMGAEFLLEDAPEEIRAGQHGRTLRTIRSSAQRASRMIDDLLDVSRIEAGRLAIEAGPEPVAPLLHEAVEVHRSAAAARGIELRWEPGESLPWVLADRDRVLQVLGNLVGNALKFTPSGGRVDLGAGADGDAVRFQVADTGPGIPDAQIPHLFDRFWQARATDRRGLGLGLAIVQGLVEAHGGRTWVESRVGEGSTFYFTIPRAPRS